MNGKYVLQIHHLRSPIVNSMEGNGEYTFPSGTKYVGSMKDGM